MHDGMDVLLETLQKQADETKARRLEAAHDEGAKKYQAMIAQATRRLEKNKGINHERIKQRYRNELSAIDKALHQDRDDARRVYVDKVLETAKRRLHQLNQEALDTILKQALTTHVNGLKPRIICSPRNHQGFVEAVGQYYQIVADESLQAGFILAFPDYDIDYRFDTIFEYRKEALRRIALQALFEAGSV